MFIVDKDCIFIISGVDKCSEVKIFVMVSYVTEECFFNVVNLRLSRGEVKFRFHLKFMK